MLKTYIQTPDGNQSTILAMVLFLLPITTTAPRKGFTNLEKEVFI